MNRTSLDMLSAILWRERDVLEHVLSAAPGDLQTAEMALRSLSSLELHRAILAREVAADHSLAGEPSLADLMEGVPLEWAAVLAGHRRALMRLADEVAAALGGAEFPARPEAEGLSSQVVRTRPSVQRSLVDFLG